MSSNGGEGERVNEHRISRLCDILQLQQVKATYCETVDECARNVDKAAASFGELFTEDAQADYGMGPLQGRSALIDFLVNVIAASNDSLWHSLHTPRIDVTGDTAVGHWTVLARLKRKGASTAEMLCGRYLDEFRRTGQGWQISSVHFMREG